MNFLKISIGVLIALSVSRFVPHPPNFTSLLALSFYIPAMFGRKYLPIVALSFVITDIFIGFHSTTLFTWGSVLLIGYLSEYFKKNTISRLFGSMFGPLIFFIFTNFGVWILGGYEMSVNGFVKCYILALPFFVNNLVSTLLFSILIEIIIKFKNFFYSKDLIT